LTADPAGGIIFPSMHAERTSHIPMRFTLLAVSAMVCLLAIVEAEQNPTLPPRDSAPSAQGGTARIRGRVTAADTARPLPGVQVVLTASFGQLRVLTDMEGLYEFSGLAAGPYSISASKTGYLNLQYGQRRPFEPGKPVTVAAGRTLDRVDLSLPRAAVIVARVTDESGAPVSGVEVRAQRFGYRADGQRTLAAIYGPGSSNTDDRGEIRLFGLMPGEYLISAVYRMVTRASPVEGTFTEGFSATFYPGVISVSDATAVAVRVGEEKAISFPLVKSRLARVSGVVVDQQGRPANGATVSLRSVTPNVFTPIARVGADGRFEIAEVPPGDYSLSSTYDAFEGGDEPLTVAGLDIGDLRVVVGAGTSVTGRVVFEGASPPSGSIPRFRIALSPVLRTAAPGARSARITSPDANGRFGFAGVSGRVIVDITSPEEWMMKSVTIGPNEFTNSVLDLGDREALTNVVITVTSRVTSVVGQVADAAGQTASDYVVVLVPAESYDLAITSRRVRAIRPATDGTFTTKGILPGRYAAVAIEVLEDGRQFSPEVHQRVRRVGQQFSVREGETATLRLRLTPDF